MNTAATSAAAPVHVIRRRRPAAAAPLAIRPGTPADADAIHELISQHLEDGYLLRRELGEVRVHASRFVVACDDDRIVGCADLAPLSRHVAEVRSLVVSEDARSLGAGRRMVDELIRRAAQDGFDKLCAFTHAPAYFVRMGFSIVPHVWLPEKIETTCRTCDQFRRCGQYAVMLPLDAVHGKPLDRSAHSCVPLASLHA